MDQLPSNSYKKREAQAVSDDYQIKAVTQGSFSEKTTSNQKIRQLKNKVFAREFSEVRSFIFDDVVVPGIKSLFVKSLKDALDMWILGNGGGNYNSTNSGYSRFGATRVNYDNMFWAKDYTPKQNTAQSVLSRTSVYDYMDVSFVDYASALDVLNEMKMAISCKGNATVNDYYQSAGLSPRSSSDCKWGWYNLNDASPVPLNDGSGGYTLKLPRIQPIEK